MDASLKKVNSSPFPKVTVTVTLCISVDHFCLILLRGGARLDTRSFSLFRFPLRIVAARPVMFSGVSWTVKSEPLRRRKHLPMYCGPNEPLRNMPSPPKMQLAHSIISP